MFTQTPSTIFTILASKRKIYGEDNGHRLFSIVERENSDNGERTTMLPMRKITDGLLFGEPWLPYVIMASYYFSLARVIDSFFVYCGQGVRSVDNEDYVEISEGVFEIFL